MYGFGPNLDFTSSQKTQKLNNHPDIARECRCVGAEKFPCVSMECNMAAILPYLRDAVFEQKDITAMSMALDDVCQALNIPDGPARDVIAERIIALATTGERSPTRLRDRVLREAGLSDAANAYIATDGNRTKRPPRWSGL
jgi:hypothetical protein